MAPVEEVFAYPASADNLRAITPRFLRLRITTPVPIEVRAGTRIDYVLVLFGLPLRWRTRITEWIPNVRFVDEQESGPFAIWRHTHVFERTKAGTRVHDRVEYALPLGPVGRAVHASFAAYWNGSSNSTAMRSNGRSPRDEYRSSYGANSRLLVYDSHPTRHGWSPPVPIGRRCFFIGFRPSGKSTSPHGPCVPWPPLGVAHAPRIGSQVFTYGERIDQRYGQQVIVLRSDLDTLTRRLMPWRGSSRVRRPSRRLTPRSAARRATS